MITDSPNIPPARPSTQHPAHDQSNDDMEFYDTDTDTSLSDPSATPDIALYGNADDTADTDADMIDDIDDNTNNTDYNKTDNTNTADKNTDDNNPDNTKDTTNAHAEYPSPNPRHYPRLSYSTDSEWDEYSLRHEETTPHSTRLCYSCDPNTKPPTTSRCIEQ